MTKIGAILMKIVEYAYMSNRDKENNIEQEQNKSCWV